MNVNTGEIKTLAAMSVAEKESDFWKRVPNGKVNDEACEHVKNGTTVDLDGNSKLAKFARATKVKGIISKKRFRDIKKSLRSK